MWRSEFGRPNGEYENVQGTWRISKIPDSEHILLFLDVENVNGQEIKIGYAGCSVCEEGNNLQLSFGIGDPDERNNLVFAK